MAKRSMGRWRVHLGLCATWVASLGAGLGCAQELPGEDAPSDALYYPSAIDVSEDGSVAYVLSSNFDKRFNTAWLSVLDLEDAYAQAQNASGILSGGDLASITVVPSFISRVRLPHLPGRMARRVQDGAVDFWISHRGSSALTRVEVGDAGQSVSCGGAPEANAPSLYRRTDCANTHVVQIQETGYPVRGCTTEEESTRQGVFDSACLSSFDLEDPFAMAWIPLPSGEEGLAVSYLGSGWVTISEPQTQPAEPLTLSPVASLFLGGGARSGLSQLQVHPTEPGILLGLSQSRATDANLSAVYGIELAAALDPTLGADGAQGISLLDIQAQAGGNALYDMAFSADGQRAFALNRLPGSLVVLDAQPSSEQRENLLGELEQTDLPRMQVHASLPLSGDPSALWVEPGPGGMGERIFVSALADDAIVVLRHQDGNVRVEARLDGVGAGPFAMTAVERDGITLLLVTTFFDHGLVAIDISSADAQNFRMVRRYRNDAIPPFR